MSEVKISVIMPCYNTSAYIEKCLDSVLCQSFTDFEIICVDDGSTDGTVDILRRYADSDSRVRIIEQKNQYAGVARNNGLAAAQGEYVVFWDSDDFFHENALELLYEKITADGADICLCDAFKYYEDVDKSYWSEDYIKYSNLPEETPFNKNDIPDKIFNFGANVPWNKMFRRDFITANGLQFQNLKQANDTYFVLMAMFLADRITYVRRRLVHYRCDSKGNLTSGKTVIPPCAFEAYGFLKKELEAREDFTEENRISFLNRAARGMLRVLHLPMAEADYAAMREFFITGGFKELDLIFEEEKYEARWIYEDIQSVFNNSPTEHLMYKFEAARVSKDKIKSKSMKLQSRLNKSEKLLEKTENKNAVLREKLEQKKESERTLKAELKAKEKELKKVTKERDNLDRTLTALRRKWYVRLFNKLERMFKGKNNKTEPDRKDEK